MEKASQDIVEKNLIFVWRTAKKAGENLQETISKPHKAYLSAGGSFFLNLEGMGVFDKIIAELKTADEVTLKFSDRYLESIINAAIIALLAVEEKDIQLAVKNQVSIIFKILAAPTIDWMLLVPSGQRKPEWFPVKKIERSKQKMVWLSSHTLVFEWEKDDLEKGTHIPLGHEVCGRKKELVIAEEGKIWGRSTS